MMKNLKRLLSMMLALSMVFSLVVPAAATETHEHDHAEEAKQEETINMESVLENITVNAENVEFELDFNNYVVLSDSDFEADMSDPAIITLETELRNITVLDEGSGESIALSEEQVQTILYLYSQYMDHWKANADVLGVQTPFFLSYNDNEDGLGVLGEMLVLAGVTVDDVRSGNYSFQDLQGTVELFLYAHIIGVEKYGAAIRSARNEVMDQIKNSGAQTEVQKLLIINDWMAHNVTFDMPYIMNNGKAENEKPMKAQNPKDHEHQQYIYDYIYNSYTQNLKQTFESNIRNGLEAEFKKTYYTEVVKNLIYQGGLAEAAKSPELIAGVKAQVGWDDAYKAALKGETQAVYDKAYKEYLDGHHTHDVNVTFGEWKEVEAEGAKTWTCTAEAKCKDTTCEAKLDAEVKVTPETTDAKCEVKGKTVFTATATVTTAGENGEKVTVGEPVVNPVTKEVEIAALEHVDENNDNKCDLCEKVLAAPHEHAPVVTVNWTVTEGVATATASLECGEGCDGKLKVSAPAVTSEVTKAATCSAKGETTYTAKVTVTDADNNPVAADKVTVKNATKTVEIDATGEHKYDMDLTTGECVNDGCDYVHTPHVDAGRGDGVCDICYADIPHTHSYNTEGVCTECTYDHKKAADHKDGEDADSNCDICGAVITPAHTHTYEWTVTTPATCTTKGEKSNKCTDATCGDVSGTEEIDALGHEFDKEVGDGECMRTGCDFICEHENNVATDVVCKDCGGAIIIRSSDASAIPEVFSFFAAATVADEGDDTTGGDTTGGSTPDAGEGAADSDIVAGENPDAHAAAMKVVEDSMDTIETAAQAKANAEKGEALEAGIQQAVTGGTEAVDTDVEKEIWAKAEAYVAQDDVKKALAADPEGYVDAMLAEAGQAEAAAEIHAGWDAFWKDAQENGVAMDESKPDEKMTVDEIVAWQMTQPQKDDMLMKRDQQGNPVLDADGNPTYMTPNEAIPVYSDMAAAQMTPGVINYWEGSHFGAFGMGTAVCLGYTKAFTYLVQYLHPEVYGTNGVNTDLSKAANWKTAQDLYYNAAGELDINQNYVVDAARVTFDASVTMFGQTEDNFNSDHFWNAVKVDGKWYYVDPCYTDVFTEVMMRDRVETDGQMNHLYFMFSDTSARELYDGNMKEIKTLYEGVATHTDYEDSWVSRIKSNTYFNGGYAYYMYDSTDMLTMMDQFNNQNQNTEADFEDPVYKIVRHKLTNQDAGTNGDSDYETLITFNYKENDDAEAVSTVYNPSTKETVTNDLLTELWHKHTEYVKYYPSISISAAFHNGKVYFNIANCIMSYDVASGAVALVKEYNTVQGKRDTTNLFGGMAFSVVTSGGDFTVENHPIAAMTIKDDGNMYVSVATNFAFISGKSDRCDPASDGYGYAYEESNYNNSYNSYMDFGDYDDDQLADFGYTREINDNDEFMWTANFVEKTSMSHLAGSSHSYEAVSVAATCGIDAYTENRCSTCGAVEADSRVYEEGTALEHHFIEFEETFYTKDSAGNWNEGLCLVCTKCATALTRPTKPSGQMAEQEGAMEDYEEALAIYEAAEATAGHDYVPTDASWANDNSTVSFKNLVCSSVCPDRKNTLDCLVNDKYITVDLRTTLTADAALVETTGLCEEGVTQVYEATGEAAKDGMSYPYTVRKVVELKPTACTYVDGTCAVCGNCAVKRVFGSGRVETALEVAKALKETLGVEKFDSIIIANGENNSFADALTGSYLANKKGAPILLYRTSGMSELNLEYIANNLSSDGTVYLLGGTGVIPAAVEEALADYNVERLAGSNRFDTNLKILEEAGVTDEEILIARGFDFADSLSASAAGLPILVVNEVTGKLTDSQIAYLEKLDGNKMTIIGGPAIITEELEAQIEEIVGEDVGRLYGATREDTSVLIADKYIADPDFAVVAYSRTSPDGLCGGPLAYAKGAPLLLTNAGQEGKTAPYVAEEKITAGYILGGTAIVSDETAKTIFGLSENAVINVK